MRSVAVLETHEMLYYGARLLEPVYTTASATVAAARMSSVLIVIVLACLLQPAITEHGAAGLQTRCSHHMMNSRPLSQ